MYDPDYHNRYKQYIDQKRYAKYLKAVKLEMFTRLLDLRIKGQIDEQIQRLTPKPAFEIHYPED